MRLQRSARVWWAIAGSLLVLAIIALPRFTTSAATATGKPTPVIPSPSATNPVLRLRMGAFDPLGVPSSSSRITSSKLALWLVQFPGPIQDAWYDAMLKAGLRVVFYIPDYAYLVWGSGDAVQGLRHVAPVRWIALYGSAYVLHPSLQHLTETAPVRVTVQVLEAPETVSTIQLLQDRAIREIRPPVSARGLVRLSIEILSDKLESLATLSGVVNIEPLLHPQRLDEVQSQILAGQLSVDGTQPAGPGYLHWLTATVGFPSTTSAYPIVDITDDGIDDGDAVPQHPDFYELGQTTRSDRLIYNVNWTNDPAADGGGGHGNLNAAIVGGYNARTGFPFEDAAGYNYGLGINPFGPIAGSKVFGNKSGWAFPAYETLVGNSYMLGARIISNSWGDDRSGGEYWVDDQIYDALVRDADDATPGEQPVTIVFAAGNTGTQGAGTISSPGNAKNVITVGASESYRPTRTDGCGIGPSGANDVNDIASFSGRGPTADGRTKPELVAPGTHIQGAATQSSTYSGAYICDPYYPEEQRLYAASSGTSHATPAVAGAASLLHRFYETRLDDAPPSPAMVKAYLVNTARYLDGVGSGDTLPSNSQGYGLVDLERAFDEIPRIVRDQTVVLHATDESYVMKGWIAETTSPFRVTLGWTDPPGATVGAAYVNDLDLLVEVDGQMYRGNVFSGATSTAGGNADPRNNVESVFLPAGVQGSFVITVTATNLAGDGVPGNGDPTDQDFALVCYNCTREPFAVAVSPSTQEICQPDPALYTVTVSASSGFDQAITLSATDYPSGMVADFAPSTMVTGETSHLTVAQTENAGAGSYLFRITADTPMHTQSTTVGLDLFAASPVSPALVAPADGAANVPPLPTLSWEQVPGAASYLFELATDAGFGAPVVTGTTRAISHTLTHALESDAAFYWRVSAQNPCGLSAPSSVYTFRTAPPVTPTSPVSIAFVSPLYSVTPAASSAPVSVTVEPSPTETVTVDYTTLDGSAVAGVHYLTKTGTLTFPPESTVGHFLVSVLSTPRTTMLTLTLQLREPQGADLGIPERAILQLPPSLYRLYLPLSLKGSQQTSNILNAAYTPIHQ